MGASSADPHRRITSDVTAIVAGGRRHSLNAYDAAYLVLAEKMAASLATLDGKLRTASRAGGVPLLIGNRGTAGPSDR